MAKLMVPSEAHAPCLDVMEVPYSARFEKWINSVMMAL